MSIRFRELNVVVVGATGAVGRELLALMEQRRFPVKHLTLYASEQTAGEVIMYAEERIVVEPFPPARIPAADIAFFCAPAEVAGLHATAWAANGTVVLDLAASGWSASGDSSLRVAGIAGPRWPQRPGRIDLPATAAGALAVVLHPLQRLAPLRHVGIALYLAASLLGKRAMEDLSRQIVGILNQRPFVIHCFAQQLAFNVLPLVGRAQAGEPSDYEDRFVAELAAVTALPAARLAATATYVPLFSGHCAVLDLEFDQDLEPAQIVTALSAVAGLCVVDEPAENDYPTPASAAERDEILVGRLRRDASRPHGWRLVAAYDNLRFAAHNALQVAWSLLEQGVL